MEIPDYDIDHADSVLMMARAALSSGPQMAAHRLSVFPRVVDEFSKSVAEVKRGRIKQAHALADAMEAVRQIVRKEIDYAIAHRGRIFDAASGLRSSMAMNELDGQYLWKSIVTEKQFSEAVDTLFKVLLEVEG